MNKSTINPSALVVPDQAALEGQQAAPGWQLLLIFVCLLSIEAITFGPSLRAIGVYLDEWTTFGHLHFLNQSLPSLMDYLMRDPRVLVRPVEIPYFAILFHFFREKPIGYHLLVVAFEVACAWFLYLATARLTKSQKLSFAAAALFLVFPSHDMTHYSIVSSSIPMSLAFYTLCLWQFIKGAEEQKTRWIIYSGVSFFISVYNYELCLPLLIVNAACGAAIMWDKHPPAKVLFLSALYQIPLLITVVSIVLMRAVVLPALRVGWYYQTSFSAEHFLYMMSQGIKVSISPFALSYYASLAQRELVGMSHLSYALLAITILAITATLQCLPEGKPHRYSSIIVIGIGMLLVLSSYSIYAISAEYVPVLDTSNNRVNSAASMGVSLILAALIGCLVDCFRRHAPRSRALAFSLLLSPLMIFFMLTDWEFAKPWVVSWNVQKIVTQQIKSHAAMFRDGDSIILANLPRFAMWCPVYNGVWDFQPTVRIALNNNRINAGVVSERMSVTQDGVTDHVGTFLCGSYAYKRMFVMVPAPLQFIPIHSRQEFLSCMTKYGKNSGFDLKAATAPTAPY